MSEVNNALQKIVKGTGLVFFGTVFSMFCMFLISVIVARYFSTEEYGIFNLVWTILNLAFLIALLGFQSSLTREVAIYKERKPSKLNDLISTSLIIVTINSLILTGILFLNAENISKIFNEPNLIYSLKISAFAIIFCVLIRVIISISRGLGRTKEQVYFQNILNLILFLIFVVVVMILNLEFIYVFFAYLVSQILTFIFLVCEIWRNNLFKFKFSLNLNIGKELLLFSIPLLFSGILGYIMTWADTIMLGYYKSSEVVGLYNAAAPIAKLLSIFLSSTAFLYAPIASQFYAQGKIKEMGRVYQILTKWVFLLTLPTFALMFLFPEATIEFFFGAKYVSAALVLQILTLGFMFHTFLGLNGLTLVIIGQPKFNMIGDTFAVISNVILNIFLIPKYGIVGAAVATTVSYVIANVFRSLWLYQKTKIHPFSWNYMKPLAISFVLLGIIKSLHLRVPDIWYAILILAVFLVVCSFLVLLSKSVDKEDVELFLAIGKKLGVDMKIIKRVLERFV